MKSIASGLTRKSLAAVGEGELCRTLNYHLSTLNFLTAASRSLQRLVRRFRILAVGRAAHGSVSGSFLAEAVLIQRRW